MKFCVKNQHLTFSFKRLFIFIFSNFQKVSSNFLKRKLCNFGKKITMSNNIQKQEIYFLRAKIIWKKWQF